MQKDRVNGRGTDDKQKTESIDLQRNPGSAGVAGEELKHYYIYADETAMDSIPAEVLERVM